MFLAQLYAIFILNTAFTSGWILRAVCIFNYYS